MKSFNMTDIKTSSDGAWQGDNPLNYAFPLLVAQTTVVLITSRFVAFLLKPLRQPRVIAEILGGILLGPSVLGRKEDFFHLLFPSWSTPILESVATIGLLFFLFLVGLELDLSSIMQSGKRAAGIALAGISLPFLFGAGVSVFLRKAVHGEEKVGYGQYLIFIGVSLSITAFPVLARILAELKLLTTQMGQTAMAAAAFNDIAAWILLALAVAIAGDATGPLTSVWVLISGVVFVAFMLFFVRPTMNWVARRSQHDFVDEVYICITLAGVLVSGFMTDLIGIHSIFGAFVFGLTIPKGGEFAAKLIKRIEDFVSCLLLPLYFASSGLKTDVAKIRGVEAWGLLLLVISTACAGKILGTFVVAVLCMIPARESLALGVLMNTKGLVELIVLNIGKEKKVLNDEMFAILVLMALFTTFMTTPTMLVICKPLRRVASQARRLSHQRSLPESSQEEFQILACVHGPRSVPAVINLIESTRSITKPQLRLCVMHLVELTDRSSSIMMVQRARRNGVPFINNFSHGTSKDKIVTAFQTYAHVSRLTVHHSTAISALAIMHEDICQVAEDKKVEMIILPFHKQWMGEGEDATENVGHGWREVNQEVLEMAPCTVAVLVDRGFGGSDMGGGATMTITTKRVCVLFLGGADDRGALELGSLMAEHPTVSVTVIRFLVTDQSGSTVSSSSISLSDTLEKNKSEKEMDEAALEDFKGKWNESVEYVEKEVNSITEEVKTIGQSRGFELIVVGKGSCLADHQMEHSELGLIGDILASSEHCITPSALVIRQGKFPEPTRSQPQNSLRARKPCALNPSYQNNPQDMLRNY